MRGAVEHRFVVVGSARAEAVDVANHEPRILFGEGVEPDAEGRDRIWVGEKPFTFLENWSFDLASKPGALRELLRKKDYRESGGLNEPIRDAYYAVALTIPLKDTLKLKKSRMELALAAYGKAAEYGVAEVATTAAFEIAELYYRLSRDLMESERPAELSPEELEQYEILLEEQAFPFEEQAIDLFAANASRTAEGIYDDAIRKSLERLAELMPARYAKTERSEDFVTKFN